MMGARLKLKATPEAHSFLGYKGTRSVAPLTELYRRVPGTGPLPGYVRCEARRRPGVPSFSRCRNIACDRCHAALQRQRREKLLHLFGELEELGFGLQLVTLNIEHDHSDRVSEIVAALTKAWKAARQGGLVRGFRKQHGLLTSLTVLELTHGSSGFHPHVHAIVIARTAADAVVSGARLAQRYEALLLRAGYRVVGSTTDAPPVWDFSRVGRLLDQKLDEDTRFVVRAAKRALQGCLCAAELFFQAAEVLAGKRFAVITDRLRRCIDARRSSQSH